MADHAAVQACRSVAHYGGVATLSTLWNTWGARESSCVVSSRSPCCRRFASTPTLSRSPVGWSCKLQLDELAGVSARHLAERFTSRMDRRIAAWNVWARRLEIGQRSWRSTGATRSRSKPSPASAAIADAARFDLVDHLVDQAPREHSRDDPDRHQVRQPTIRLRLRPSSAWHATKLRRGHSN